MKKIIITLSLLACVAFNLSGCSQSSVLYRVNIQQGNVITQDMVKQLRKGMTKEQVADIMGPPVMADTFSENRWNYVFYFKPGKGKIIVCKYVTVYFINCRVSQIFIKGKLE